MGETSIPDFLDDSSGNWRPIETAPRDGTIIWVMDPDAGAFPMRWNPETTNALFSNAKGMWEMPDGGMTWCEDTDAGPTRWQPYGH